MTGRQRVHVVIERTDGSRIARVPAPRWLVSVVLGLAGLLVVSAGALYRDYVTLTAQRTAFATLQSRMVAQQALIDGFQERVATMRAEIDGWRDLRTRIWQPFGPGPEGNQGADRGLGIGGSALSKVSDAQIAPTPSLIEELDHLATVVTEEGESLRALERFIGKAGRVLAALPSRWPVRGPVNSDFGHRSAVWADGAEFHSGLDIGAPRGTPVAAPAPGTVVFAGWQAEYGNTLILDHGNDITTLYGHLAKLGVKTDEKVQRGQVVAYTGNTGRSSGPHLHYEIQVAGRAVNPRSYLWDE